MESCLVEILDLSPSPGLTTFTNWVKRVVPNATVDHYSGGPATVNAKKPTGW